MEKKYTIIVRDEEGQEVERNYIIDTSVLDKNRIVDDMIDSLEKSKEEVF